MKLGIILSNDWELYGDGSGNYFEVMHRPLENLLRCVENHGAKLTVMAEIGQQWAHMKIAENEKWAQEICVAWDSIVQETIKRKSDVQLHLHPQWLNARNQDQKWHVDCDHFAISDFCAPSRVNVLKKGKQYLDRLLQPVDSDYECIAFRAGGYFIEPSKFVIKHLRDAGILCDTSVTKGLYYPGFFDYRDAHSNCVPWFSSSENIKYKSDNNEGILEIPIYSRNCYDWPLFRKLVSPELYYKLVFRGSTSEEEWIWFGENNAYINKRYPRPVRPLKQSYQPHLLNKSKYLLQKCLISKRGMQLDYDVLPAKKFVKYIEEIYDDRTIEKSFQQKDVIIPVMASGHVKSMQNCDNISRILDEINSHFKDNVVFWTLSEAVKYLVEVN